MDKFNFDRVVKNLQNVKTVVPKKIANETKNFFVREFNSQSWDGTAWRPVLRASRSGGSSRNRSAILVQSGKLRRGLINSIREASFNKILLQVVDVSYAKGHNEGLNAGRSPGFKMPKRTFMGQTKRLTTLQREIIVKNIDAIWRG